MAIEYFIKGLLIGISVAAPVGPIGVLTIKRTLSEGRLSGFMTGMGAATADASYGIIAGFGLTAVSAFLMSNEFWLKIMGSLFLIYLGIKSYLNKPPTEAAKDNSRGLFKHFISTFFLTITNPTTILSFLAIFTALGIVSEGINYISSMILVLGVFLGSAIWWLFLSWVVNFLKSKVTPSILIWINRISGILIILLGLWTLYSAVF